MKIMYAAMAFVGVAMATSHARAQASEPAPAFAPTTQSSAKTNKQPSKWYGLPIAVTDATLIGLTVASKQVILLPITYMVVGPSFHMVKGQRGRALGSLGMRVGFTTIGALIGYNADAQKSQGTANDDPGLVGLLYGGLTGMVLASLLDSVWLAREPIAEAPVTPTLLPDVSIGADRVTFGFSGSF